ncbi:MAG: aminodeoxychorismate/anthranilate synthase component II [bacterium]
MPHDSLSPKVLIIDHYDSFTYMIVDYITQLTNQKVHVYQHDYVTAVDIDRLSPTHIILSPGPGHPANPQDFSYSKVIITNCSVPILGICLGHQGIALAFGDQSSVALASEPAHGSASEIFHAQHPLFSGIPSPFMAGRYHSLLVTDPLPVSLKKIAWMADGTIMGLAHITRPLFGIQFHPESILCPFGKMILANFLGVQHDSEPI